MLPETGNVSIDRARLKLTTPLVLALLGLPVLLLAVGNIAGSKHVLATIVGIAAGVALYHASFGFTSAWRKFLQDGRSHGLRSQFLLILLTSVISYPLLAYGSEIGFSISGAVAPIGLAVIFGAFLFGFGMMFAGGCGSGTLFTVGGGSVRMLITLSAFIAGSLIGTLHLPWWRSFQELPRISMIETMGPFFAFLTLFIVLGSVWWLALKRERNLHGDLEEPARTVSFVHGPWSPRAGAIAIAFVGVATFLVLERPWGITSAFSLWGAKIATGLGVDVAAWPYWQARSALLERNVLLDTTSTMNFGIIGGAFLASNLANKFNPSFRLSWTDSTSAILGGLLMGYGARLAYGCNIGAYLGGLISGSLHGWLWMLAAFTGSAMALKFQKLLSA